MNRRRTSDVHDCAIKFYWAWSYFKLLHRGQPKDVVTLKDKSVGEYFDGLKIDIIKPSPAGPAGCRRTQRFFGRRSPRE